MEYEAITKDENAIIYKRMSVGEIQRTAAGSAAEIHALQTVRQAISVRT